ncbi:MAG: cell division protein ZipA C-terminal FtsZ-binding domain-containing protein [Betaproteobacteria bacterium]
MTSLQLGLILAGIALVIGVIVYNWRQERRLRAAIDDAIRPATATGEPGVESNRPSPRSPERVEPTLGKRNSGDEAMLTRAGTGAAIAAKRVFVEDLQGTGDFEIPVQVRSSIATTDTSPPHFEIPSEAQASPEPPGAAATQRVVHADGRGALPDPDIECIIALQPAKPIMVGLLAAGLQARLGKRLRWFGRRGVSMPWQLLKLDTTGEFSDVVACLLLADRTGAASVPMLEAFTKLVTDLAPSLPAALIAPEVTREAARAEALDRICADLDVQIGLTILKPSPATITGTRLRGVAEAAGFRLASGRFEWVQEETGAVLYALQNFRADPFTVDSLRANSTPGAVFLLDVPRVADPVRVFDHMKLAAKRMAKTLDAELVDDNRRALDDSALASIRQQIQKTAAGLQAVNIEPGSPRALALFGG